MEKSNNKFKLEAKLSFIFGLCFWVPLLNIIFGIAAIILGIKSIKSIKRHPDKYGGFGYSVAGIILGLLPIIFFLAGLGICLSGNRTICTSMGLSFLP